MMQSVLLSGEPQTVITGTNMQKYLGYCHCRAVKFEVETDFRNVFVCNCSFCVRRGVVMNKVPSDLFRIFQGEELTGKYGEREFSKHFFCKECGIQCFTRITRSNESSVAVNVGCLEGVGQAIPEPYLFDGANLL